MDEQERLRLLLELDRGAGDVLSGRIGAGGELQEFYGWLSLIAAIEGARRLPDGGARSPPEAVATAPDPWKPHEARRRGVKEEPERKLPQPREEP